MSDPRATNCRGYSEDGAHRCTGVYLEVQPAPGSRYELVRAELIDEAAAQGQTVATCAVLDGQGVQTAERVWLAWPYPGLSDGRLLPGNSSNQHMVTNGYKPPEVGPLACYVGDAAGEVLSDIVGGLGLPFNKHVSFRLTWRERGVVVDAEPEPEPGDVVGQLRRIADALERIAAR